MQDNCTGKLPVNVKGNSARHTLSLVMEETRSRSKYSLGLVGSNPRSSAKTSSSPLVTRLSGRAVSMALDVGETCDCRVAPSADVTDPEPPDPG